MKKHISKQHAYGLFETHQQQTGTSLWIVLAGLKLLKLNLAETNSANGSKVGKNNNLLNENFGPLLAIRSAKLCPPLIKCVLPIQVSWSCRTWSQPSETSALQSCFSCCHFADLFRCQDPSAHSMTKLCDPYQSPMALRWKGSKLSQCTTTFDSKWICFIVSHGILHFLAWK